MSGQIFISYRREESSAWAGRLSDRLSNHFPSNQIFMDVDSVDLGEDFVKTIEKTVGSCDVLIAVIGKGWLSSCDKEGQRRLDNSEDFVRIEIATALKRDIRVIPVLVDGVSMPQSRDLPDDLKALVRRNALQLSHDRFRTDSERLASAVERALEKTAAERREREDKEQLEAERRETEAKERLEAERRQKEEQEQLAAQQRENDRVGAEQRQRERLDAERREKERLKHESHSQPPTPVAPSAPPAKPEADKPSAETPKVVYPLPPKPSEPERVKPPPPSSGGTGGKSPSKQVSAFLAIAAVLVVGGLIYLAIRASQSPPPQPAPVVAVTPSPPMDHIAVEFIKVFASFGMPGLALFVLWHWVSKGIFRYARALGWAVAGVLTLGFGSIFYSQCSHKDFNLDFLRSESPKPTPLAKSTEPFVPVAPGVVNAGDVVWENNKGHFEMFGTVSHFYDINKPPMVAILKKDSNLEELPYDDFFKSGKYFLSAQPGH